MAGHRIIAGDTLPEIARPSAAERYAARGRLIVLASMLFLLVLPMYVLLDALITRIPYSLIVRVPAACSIAYFVLAGIWLAILPSLIERYRPFPAKMAFVFSGVVVLVNVVALFVFLTVVH